MRISNLFALKASVSLPVHNALKSELCDEIVTMTNQATVKDDHTEKAHQEQQDPEVLQNQLESKVELCKSMAEGILENLGGDTPSIFPLRSGLGTMKEELQSVSQTHLQVKNTGGGGLARVDQERIVLGIAACEMAVGVLQIGRTGNYFPELIDEVALGNIYSDVVSKQGPTIVKAAMEQVLKIDPSKADSP